MRSQHVGWGDWVHVLLGPVRSASLAAPRAGTLRWLIFHRTPGLPLGTAVPDAKRLAGLLLLQTSACAARCQPRG